MNQRKTLTIMIAFIILFFLLGLMQDWAEAGICPTSPCVDSVDIQDGSIAGADISIGTSLTLGGLAVNGNVGIGTSTPGTKLHVSGGTLTVSHNTNMDFITLYNNNG